MLEIQLGKSHLASPVASLTQSFHPLTFYLGVTSGYNQALIYEGTVNVKKKKSFYRLPSLTIV